MEMSDMMDDFLNQQLGAAPETAKKQDTSEQEAEALSEASVATPEITDLQAGSPEQKKEEMQDSVGAGSIGAARIAEDDIDSLIKEANSLISKGDFDGARKVYLRIKELKDELPRKRIEKEQKIETGLLDLNERMVEGMDRTLTSDFNSKFSGIKDLLEQAYIIIKGDIIASMDDLKRVEDIYARIKGMNAELPAGFMEKSVMVQDQMLKLYKIMIISRKNLLLQDFNMKSEEIIRLMNAVISQINSGSMDDASKTFSRLTGVYRQLPSGFLKEKTDLQKRILDIYQQIITGKEGRLHDEFDSIAAQIDGRLNEAYALLKKGSMKEALDAYRRISELYSKLPPGYYSRRADIEVRMMELHHIITLKDDKDMLEESNSKIGQMDLLLQSAGNYLASGEYDMVKEVYEEIVQLYNSLPAGFFEQNIKVQNRIINLYKDILSHMHQQVIAETTGTEKVKYESLLKLLVDIHTHIKKKDFAQIKPKYLTAYRLYHELPLSLIEEKKDLYREIYKIYEELRLMASVEKLAEHAERSEFADMAALLDSVATEYNILSKKYPADIELFNHIQSKSLLYLEMLKRQKELGVMPPASGYEIRKKIENVVEAKKDAGASLPQNGGSEGSMQASQEDADDADSKAQEYISRKYVDESPNDGGQGA